MKLDSKLRSPGDLYVLQAECGLIKIGRTADLKSRLKSLSARIGERLTVVMVLAGRGHEEDRILRGMSRYRTVGEWFLGHDHARAKLEELLGARPEDWPYSWKPKEAEELTSHLGYAGDRKAMLRQRAEIKADLRRGVVKRETNAKIWQSLEPGIVIIGHFEKMTVERFYNGQQEGPLEPPDYINDVVAAKSIAPRGWPGLPDGSSPIDIVVAALDARTRYESAPETALRLEATDLLDRDFFWTENVAATFADGRSGLIELYCRPKEARLSNVGIAMSFKACRSVSSQFLASWLRDSVNYVGAATQDGTSVTVAFAWAVGIPIAVEDDEIQRMSGMIEMAKHFRVGIAEGWDDDFDLTLGSHPLYRSKSGWTKRAEAALGVGITRQDN